MSANTSDIRYRWKLLRAGPLRLDGGSMFGLVPKVVWSRLVSSDEQNRITVAHNCLLLERVDEPRRVLIETGSGDKLDEKMRHVFGLDERSIKDVVEETGISCDVIDTVIVSHLHFDHAGGLTRRVQPGEKPDWIDPNYPAGVKLTFGRASIIVQRRNGKTRV